MAIGFPRQRATETARDADILVLGTPIWLGDKSSVCSRLIERLYALSGQVNAAGQYIYYERVAVSSRGTRTASSTAR